MNSDPALHQVAAICYALEEIAPELLANDTLSLLLTAIQANLDSIKADPEMKDIVQSFVRRHQGNIDQNISLIIQ